MINFSAGRKARTPVHRHLVGIDIVAFGRRPDGVQARLRESLYRIIEEAAEDSGLPWQDCYREDRGDGLFAVCPDGVGVELLLGSFLLWLRAGVREHNALAHESARLRLRLAVDAGNVVFDSKGVLGSDLIRMFRLLDAPMFKRLLSARTCELGLIVSDQLYSGSIKDRPRLPIDAEAFAEIPVKAKETQTPGWVWMPVTERAWLGREEPVARLARLDTDGSASPN